ncbi:glycoside hydrolase family 2 TIM barrel-domain containing protein [Aquimarina celericrescens]|uniref:Glycoside hydrolase family 2 TIM barrel-domain containing protein n=1 Tax=Aquimarina celericrescens TaxID=1964542 RepID=A0ABW5B3B2_9FLAO|nr:DUF4982 domain-containing protein [Aquimarina celericrescens]
MKNHQLHIIVILILVSIVGCSKQEHLPFDNQRNISFNAEWKFFEGHAENAEDFDFDDSDWETVHLPHDYSTVDVRQQDSIHVGPFVKSIKDGKDVGYLRGGIAWYRKELTLSDKEKNKRVILHFDGVQSETTLWVNGTKVGEHHYGYTAFYFDLTSYLKENVPNSIAIKVVTPEQSSRWFTGAGLYRNVGISFVHPIHFKTWGAQIVTSHLSKDEATITIDSEIKNTTNQEANIEVAIEIFNDQKELAQRTNDTLIHIPALKEDKLRLKTQVSQPHLWNLDAPLLYTAKLILKNKGKIIDEYHQEFGIRSLDFSAKKGFLLNGKETLLKGACIHHDNGLLGAAAYPEAEERRVRLLKENGFNAIRTAHNPPSKAFLEACDRLGMLVIDEAFDMWIEPKKLNGYSRHFEKSWKKDLGHMVLRDRNHPSVIMWSIGNEIKERADSTGLAIAREMISHIKELDSTRPITQGVNTFWDHPGREWPETASTFELLDVAGYNYKFDRYEEDHNDFPERIMYGSESMPNQAYENWQLVEKLPYVIGDFVWTGMDYLGESGIAHSTYQTEKDVEDSFTMPWPWYISWCGDIDIIGNKKPQSYYRDVLWKRSDLEILVHEPIPKGTYELLHYWAWPKESKSWNWQGYENRILQVSVYSNCPEIRLELNGKVIDQKKITNKDKLTAQFFVPYQPGELKAVCISENSELTQIINTSGEAETLKLIQENKTADENDKLIYLQVSAIDKNNNLVPNSAAKVMVSLEGGLEMLAAGNASPLIEGSLKDQSFNLYEGKGLIILRKTSDSENTTVTVTSDQLKAAQIKI